MTFSIVQLKVLLHKHEDIGVAFLFGSTGSGTQKVDSDLDVGVAGPAPLSPEKKFALIEELGHASGRPVDLIDLRTAGPVILTRVLTQGVCIFKKDTDLYAHLLKKMWYANADLMPNIEMIPALDVKDYPWIGRS